MPLSRHFYALDEVQAAFSYTTSRYDAKEALFWCQEMISSGCIGECISTLFESWMWHKGPFALSWLLNAWTTLQSNELSEDAILLSAYQLTSRKKDHSLWNILLLSNDLPDRVTPKTPPLSTSLNEKELYFLRAIYQGKAHSAWWISRYMDKSRVWDLLTQYVATSMYAESYRMCFEALQGYEHLLGYRSDEYDEIVRCMAVLSACLSLEKQKESFSVLPCTIDVRMNVCIEDWRLHVGRKVNRSYTIPTACLYGRTQRGNMQWSQHNLVQLNCVEKYIIGCPFWEEALLEYGVIHEKDIQWTSDARREAFYQRYFPDDIPDEWTLLDKKKSHGDGILGPTDQVTLLKYARTHLSGSSTYAWNTTKKVLAELVKRQLVECDPSNVVSLGVMNMLDESLLEPIHKRHIKA